MTAPIGPKGPWLIDLNVPHEDPRINTRITGNTESVCFDTTDHEGNDTGESFELTWPEVFRACKEYYTK